VARASRPWPPFPSPGRRCYAWQGRLARGCLIACPKLDQRLPAYVEKVEAIFRTHDIRSATIAHMEVPCCAGIVHAVRTALEQASRADVEFLDVTVGIDGRIQRES